MSALIIQSDFYELVTVFEKYLFNHDLNFKVYPQGDDDIKYTISFGAYGLNVFLKHATNDASLIVSPFLKDKDNHAMFFPIIERHEHPSEMIKHIRSVVGGCIKGLDLYNTLLNRFSTLCVNQCKADDHDMEEGYQTVQHHDGSKHLIYYFHILMLNRFGQEYRADFIFDFHGLSYEFKYRINNMEFISVLMNDIEDVAIEKIDTCFASIYNQIYVPAFIYEMLLVKPRAYGDNIIPFRIKK